MPQVLHRQSVPGGFCPGGGAVLRSPVTSVTPARRGFHVTILSRNGAGFSLILCEMTWKNRAFFALEFARAS